MKVAVLGPVLGHTSYSFVCGDYVTGLLERGHEVRVCPLSTPQDEEYKDPELVEIVSLCASPEDYEDVEAWADARVAFTVPHTASAIQEHTGLDCSKWALHTVWETTRLPDEYDEALNEWGAVLTTTEFCANIYREHGHDVGPLVPQGIDPDFWSPVGRRENPTDKTLFVTVADVTARKGLEYLWEAYGRAFTGRDDVELAMKLWSSRDALADEDIKRMCNFVADYYDVHVSVTTRTLSDEHLRQFMAAGDAFVLPTRGEGWCRPAFEALAVGTMPIVTGWGAHAETLPSDYWRSIDYELGPVDEPFASYAPPQEWATPDKENLIEHLEHVHENTKHVNRKARVGSAKVRNTWTLDHAAERMEHALRSCYEL